MDMGGDAPGPGWGSGTPAEGPAADHERPPLDLSPIHAEFYGVHFHEWSGDVARLHSGLPENAARQAEIELVLGQAVELIPTDLERVRELNQARYGVAASSVSSVLRPGDRSPGEGLPGTAAPPTVPGPVRGGARLSAEPSVIRFVERMIHKAFDDQATDIHIEPYEGRVDIRYRIDGVLHQVPVPREVKALRHAVVSRLKILSHLDIAEQRLPQDGRFRFILDDGRELDIRVSILPTAFGEAVDLRLLTTQQVYKGLGSLGLSEDDQKRVADILQRPHGVVLVTGPTGSGKTTTLYAFLTMLNETARKIITIEDPIEYQIPGITQIQVHPKIDLTFARGLRSMLRHDPDVMMVGEIRDSETADTAVQVALTGHLVFSTVHTNDAPSTPARLINMGVESYLVASSLECVIAQRLVRLVCAHCREQVRSTQTPLYAEMEQQIRSRGIPWDGVLSRGRGCERCMGTGYRGRTAIYEILPVTGDVQSVILQQAAASTLRAVAEKEGFRSMRWDGLYKVADGRTTYEEVLRVTRKEVY
jgi:general secretion pathway protein E